MGSKGYLDVCSEVSNYVRHMIAAFLMTRGSGLLILLASLSIYVVSKNYQEVLLHGQSGFSFVEIAFLVSFYCFFKQIQQENIRAKFYALLPLFSYYAVYEYNLLQFGSVLKFQDILLVSELLDVLPIAEVLGLAGIASIPLLLVVSNMRRKWRYGNLAYIATFLFSVVVLTTINPLSKTAYGFLYIQSFSHQHVVAAYGPLSTAFIYENKRKTTYKRLINTEMRVKVVWLAAVLYCQLLPVSIAIRIFISLFLRVLSMSGNSRMYISMCLSKDI